MRVGLLACGWFQRGNLFPTKPRDFAVIVLSPTTGHRLVSEYRDEVRVRVAIPHGERLVGLPRGPFVGELDYTAIVQILNCQRDRFTRAERVIAQQLVDYLAFKRKTFPARGNVRQARLVEMGTEDVLSATKGKVKHQHGITWVYRQSRPAKRAKPRSRRHSLSMGWITRI